MTDKHAPTWRAIGESVRGDSHFRHKQRKQDAIKVWQPESAPGRPLILAVSDGHGSARSFRSHLGANRAVRAAITELGRLLESQPDLANLSAIKRLAEERLPQVLVREWERQVDAHLRQQPFPCEELDGLEEKAGAAARQAVQNNPRLAYGATLLAVLVTEAFVLYLQLGDGDILTVSETGAVTRPLPRDERLFANETTSLCTRNAWRDFRVAFRALAGSPPALILLATDGYANSFRDDAGFLQVGADLLEIIRSDGLETVQASLKRWLNQASRAGSGDDVTLGIVCR